MSAIYDLTTSNGSSEETPTSVLNKWEALLEKREIAVQEGEARLKSGVAALRESEERLSDRLIALEKREAEFNTWARARVEEKEMRNMAHTVSGAVDVPINKNVKKTEFGETTPARQKDPLDDVPALVEAFHQSGGVLPLGVLVAEVEALQQAATRLHTVSDGLKTQIHQLEQREKLKLPEIRRIQLNEALDRLRSDKERCLESAATLLERFIPLRDGGIRRFTPLLLKTVNKFEAAFEGMIDAEQDSEKSLKAISELCKEVQTKGWDLRQPLPSAKPSEHLDTLMLLMERAMHAKEKLERVARDAVMTVQHLGPVSIMSPGKPTKGIMRALQKTLEEYNGDYTRLLDYTRISLVSDSLKVLHALLTWFLDEKRQPGLRVCRIKDRLSRGWDAEMSGGNRDVLLNAWLSLGGGRWFIVEIQLHVRILLELKSDLHVLYAGARVLGALDDSTALHEGVLSAEVLSRAEQGVVRKIITPFSPFTEELRNTLGVLIKREPCALIKLDLSYAVIEPSHKPVFDGWTLAQLFIPSTGTLACRRLRELSFSFTGIGGEFPSALQQCLHLQVLNLGQNVLEGPIPHWIGELPLKKLILAGNKLTGPIPDSIEELSSSLESFVVSDNMLSGEVPSACLAKLKELKMCHLGADSVLNSEGQVISQETNKAPFTDDQLKYLKNYGLDYWNHGGGNPDLTINAAGQAQMAAALPKGCSFTWPRVVVLSEDY